MDILQTAKDVLALEASELKRHENMLNASFVKACEEIFHTKGKLIVTGVGKSGHIGAKIAATLASTGTPSFFLHPTEAMHGDLGMISQNDSVLAISFSGQSSELLAIMPHIRRRGIKIISMAKSSSTLATLSDVNISLDILKEACPLGAAPTVSTTLSLALGDALCVCLMKMRNFTSNDFASFHPGGTLGKRLYLKLSDIMRVKNLPLVSQDASLREAINAISEGKLGTALLVDDTDALKAVLSDGDLRRAMQSADFSLDAKALKYANTKPKTLDDDEILAYDALKMIEQYKIQILIITKAKKVAGVVHIHDLTTLGL